MKLRTDFITNSSSSSFIFEKGIDLSEFKQRAIEKHKVVYERSQYKDYRYENGEDILQHLEQRVERISELDYWALMELYDWYEDDVVKQWLKKEPKELSQWSAEGKQKLFVKYYIDFIFFLSREYHTIYTTEKKQPIDTEQIYENFQWECVEFLLEQLWDDKTEKLAYFLENEYESVDEYFREMSQKTVSFGDLIEAFFDCELVLYSELEAPWFMSLALEETEGCLWGCNHMIISRNPE